MYYKGFGILVTAAHSFYFFICLSFHLSPSPSCYGVFQAQSNLCFLHSILKVREANSWTVKLKQCHTYEGDRGFRYLACVTEGSNVHAEVWKSSHKLLLCLEGWSKALRCCCLYWLLYMRNVINLTEKTEETRKVVPDLVMNNGY